ncbi:MAG: putative lipid II flippase FtsW [Bacillota bacterium]
MAHSKKSPDFTLFVVTVILLAIGIVMVFSASSVKAMVLYEDALYYLKRQALWAVMGLAAAVLFMNMDYRFLKKLALPFFGIGMVLLVMVLVPGLGKVGGGAQRWLDLGPLRVQPSEVIKVAMVLFLANSLARKGSGIARFWQGLLPYIGLMGLVFLLVLRQPDLGTALSIVGTIVVMLFVAGARLGHLSLMGLASIPVVYWAIFSEEYRRRRFLAFLNPWEDLQDTGYHIAQSLYALGSGGLFGLGVGGSHQKFFYLPALHTDFIFAVLGEEMGFLGTSTVLLLFLVFAWRGFRVAVSAPDTFGCLLATGITAMITIQAIINIGVVTATLPITGIPLPLLSSGGSSLVLTLASVGMLLGISRWAT